MSDPAISREDYGPLSSKTSPAAKFSWLLTTAGLILFVILRAQGGKQYDGRQGPAIGKPLSRLELKSVANNRPLRVADAAGHVVLIHYWGPWCLFCREEMPHLIRLQAKHAESHDFLFLSVICAPSVVDEGKELARQSFDYLDELGADFPVYFDPNGSSRVALAGQTGLKTFGYPTTVIVDRDGKIRGLWEGFQPGDEKNMADLLEELLPPSVTPGK